MHPPACCCLAQIKSCRGKNLFFSTAVEEEVAASDIIFVSVNTPTKTFGIGSGYASDVKNIEAAARMIARVCSKGTHKIIVEKSTVPVKTAETLRRVLHAQKNANFSIISSPEFLAEGTAVKDLEMPSRVLIGGDQTPEGHQAMATLAAVYAQWVPRNKVRGDRIMLCVRPRKRPCSRAVGSTARLYAVMLMRLFDYARV